MVKVTRYLGVENIGELNYAISLVSFFTIFASLGLNNVVQKSLVNQTKEYVYRVLSTSFISKIAGGVVGVTLAVFAAFLLGGTSLTHLLLIVFVGVSLLLQPFEIFDAYYQSELKSKKSTWVRNCTMLMAAVAKLIAVFQSASLLTFGIIYGLEVGLGLVAVFVLFFRQNPAFRFSFDSLLAKQFLAQSWPLALSGLMGLLYMRVDQIMIVKMLDQSANGIYATGVRIIELVYIIPMALAPSFLSAFGYLKSQGEEAYSAKVKQYLAISSVLSLVGGVALYLLAPVGMPLLFGEEFSESYRVVQVYALSLPATFWGVAVTQVLISKGWNKIPMYRTLMGLLVNLVLNFLWIPKYGFHGAAYASLISYFVTALSVGLFTKTRSLLWEQLGSISPVYWWKAIVQPLRKKG